MPVALTLSRRLLAVLMAAALGALLTACGSSTPTVTTTSGPGASSGSSSGSSSAPASASTSAASPGSGSGSTVRPTDAAQLAPATPVSNLRTMRVAQLPPEGIDTLRLIESGGPFPFSKDGVTFSNREGLLPQHKTGWYQEYTVITPGSPDRGARRIIGGKDGERYYTDDHYASFREVLSGVSG